MKNSYLMFALLSITLTTVSLSQSGWYWQNPKPQGNELKSISFVNDEGWAVGMLGTAIHTSDAGTNWELVDLGTSEDLYSVYMHDADMIWTVGGNGLILYIHNNGTTIDVTPQVSNTTETLYSIRPDFTDCIWVSGDNGVVIKSSDFGQTWFHQNCGYTYPLYSLDQVECNNAWSVSTNGHILHTSDTGNNWEIQYAATNRHLFMVDVAQLDNIRICGQVGTILHSTNQGANWMIENSNTTNNLYGIMNIGTNSAYACGDDGTILETLDYGVTWNQMSTGVITHINDLDYHYGLSYIWAAGYYGVLLSNSGAGTNFEIKNQGTMLWLSSVEFVDENTGWIVGGDPGWGGATDGVILHTFDAGSTWTEQQNLSTPLTAVDFINSSEGWAVGKNGLIKHTVNGGQSWLTQTSSVSTDLNALNFIDADNGWAVGRYSEILHTTNGGSTWTRQTSPAINYWLYGVHFVNSTTGWAVGFDSTVIYTTNAGTTWQRKTTNAHDGHLLNEVYFVDELHGWIVGVEGMVLLTTDGGATWNDIDCGTYQNLYSIYFTDPNNGWVSGDLGTVLRTTDGGFTWYPQFSNVAGNSLYSVCFTDTLNGWVVGEGGTIMHTTDGGGIVDVKSDEMTAVLPEDYILSQNYPNPFNPSTTIKWQMPEPGSITLTIYDILGKEVTTLINKELNAGRHQVSFDASSFSSGIYFYQLRTGDFIKTKKMVLLK